MSADLVALAVAQNRPDPMHRLVYGYVWTGASTIDELPALRDTIATAAHRHGLVLADTYSDYSERPPSRRPALQTLMAVVQRWRPFAVLVPNAQHLSKATDETTALLEQFRMCDCKVLAVETGTVSLLVPAPPIPRSRMRRCGPQIHSSETDV
jgi:DNA invertase Pin-like site-specific DNA recombinase